VSEVVPKSKQKQNCSSECSVIVSTTIVVTNSLSRVMLDAFARRHEAQKIYLRQGAALRWVEWRDSVLAGERPHGGNANQLDACDVQLRVVSI
jgi:hypothetical protein